MGDFLPWIRHYRVCGIHELVETQFVEELVGFLSVSIEDKRFFSLERFVISLDRVRIRRELW